MSTQRDGNVRFVRIRGRVVPIRTDGAGGGGRSGAFASLRKRKEYKK